MYIIINKDEEIFRDIDYPRIKKNQYQVSNYGTVINKKTGKTIKSFLNRKGYARLVLMGENKKPINMEIQRLVAWQFVEGYNEENGKTVVNHKNGDDRANNYYENLEWTTVEENNEHGLVHGRIRVGATGELNHAAKYSNEVVHKICHYLKEGYTQMQIMHEFGHHKRKDNNSLYSLIDGIKQGRWKHISKEYDL